MQKRCRIRALVTGETESLLSLVLFNEARALNLPLQQIAPYGLDPHRVHPDGRVVASLMAPVHAWLIHGPGGPILVDTGLPSCEEVQRVVAAQGGEVKPCRQKPEWSLDRQLAAAGVAPEEIKTVILTHLHGDHYGNNELLPRARFLAHPEEIALCLAPPPWAPFYRPGFTPHLSNVMDRVDAIDRDYHLTEGIQILHVGGHSPGLLAVLVETERGRVAIASDLIYSYKNLELNWPIGSFWNLSQLVAGMQRLRDLADVVLPSHDWELWQRYPDGIIG